MKIAVLMGGISPEREVSLRSGAGVARALIRLGHEVTLLDTGTGKILPDPDAAHALAAAGVARAAPEAAWNPDAADLVPAITGPIDLARAVPRGVDLAFIALHGGDGENGTIQALLDLARIPYTGSGVLASAVAMDKALSKRLFRDEGIPTPEWLELWPPRDPAVPWTPDVSDEEIRRLGGYPVVVKPNDAGSSVGIHIVERREELLAALRDARRFSPLVLIEAFVEGREVTVTVLNGRALPVVEIIPTGGWYDYEHKYTPGASRYEVPAAIPQETSERLLALGLRACRALRVTGVVRVDFRLHPDGTAHCLEANTVPGLTELSLVPMAARAAGLEYEDLVRAIVDGAPVRAAR